MRVFRGLLVVGVVGATLSAQALLSKQDYKARVKGLPADTYWGGFGDISTKSADYLVYVPKQEFWNEKKDPKEKGTGYNDHFQVLRDEKRKLLYAFWTQASWESAGDHHVVFSKSADDGKTWTEPVTLAGCERRAYRSFIADWQQPMLSKSGRLYCLYNMPQDSPGGARYLCGTYSDDGGETWADPRRTWSSMNDPTFPPGWINWQRPIRVGENGKYMSASSLDRRVEFWQFENIDDDPPIQDIKVSVFAKGKDSISIARLAEKSDYHPKFESVEEGAIVKLPDGRLFCLMRSTTGHALWSQSRDQGRSWSDPKFLRDRDGGYAYLHCCSPCPIYDYEGCAAGSGKYFAFVHDKFDFANTETASQDRPELYMLVGTFDPKAEQPIRFAPKKLFVGAPHGRGNSFYTSYTVFGKHHILWYPDGKYYLKGIEINL